MPTSPSTETGKGSGLELGPFLTTAARLIACNVNPIPLKARSKRPAIDWKKLQDELLIAQDWDRVDAWLAKWWSGDDHGIGVVTGKASDLVVIDIDSDEAAIELGPIEVETVTVRTPRGRHFWFRHVEGARNRAHVDGVKIDVRADGGFVVVPPTIHRSGVRYEWEVSPFISEGGVWPPAEMPERLRRRLFAPRSSFAHVRPRPLDVPTTRYVAAVIERELEAVRTAPEGSRNDTLNRAAFAVARFIGRNELAPREVAEQFVAAACSSGLTEDEARRTVASAIRSRWTS